MFNNLFELNDNGTYGPNMDSPTEQDIREMQKSLFELYEKNAFMYQKMGYIEGFTPGPTQRKISEYEKFDNYEKEVCQLINTVMDDDGWIYCPKCETLQSTLDSTSVKIDFNGDKVRVAFKECFMEDCDGEMYFFKSLIREPKETLSYEEIEKKRDEYLKKLDKKMRKSRLNNSIKLMKKDKKSGKTTTNVYMVCEECGTLTPRDKISYIDGVWGWVCNYCLSETDQKRLSIGKYSSNSTLDKPMLVNDSWREL